MPKLHFFTKADNQALPQAEKEPKKPKPPKEKYRIINWPDYNKALINRGFITLWLDEDTLANWYYQDPPTAGGLFRYRSGDPVQSMHSGGSGSQSGLWTRVSANTRPDSEYISDYEDRLTSTQL